MIDTDKTQFAEILTGLAELYDKEFTAVAMRLWFEALRAYDIEAISAAVSAHVRSPDFGQFPLKPADVVKMLNGTSKDAAFVAWTKTDRAVRRIGVNESVAFDDPLIHRVIADMGGWVQFGEKTEKEWPFVANEFQNRYHAYKSRHETPEYPPALLGNHEAENGGKFDDSWYQERKIKKPSPILIGNPGRAKLVMAGGSDRPVIEFTRASDVLELPQPAKEVA